MSDVFTAENKDILTQYKITHILIVSAGLTPRYPGKYVYK